MLSVIFALTSVLGATYDVPGDYTTLQAAHNAASAGDTIRVYGVQPGPLRITKPISVMGGDADAAIIATGPLPVFTIVDGTIPNQYWTLVAITDTSGVTLENLLIDGRETSADNPSLLGLLIRNADATIKGVRLTGMISAQWGSGLLAASGSTVQLQNVVIDQFSNFGAHFLPGTRADWYGGHVIGQAAPDQWQHHGIVFGPGRPYPSPPTSPARGSLQGVIIEDVWAGMDYFPASEGVRVMYADEFVMSDCIIRNCEGGLYTYESDITLTSNLLMACDYNVQVYGTGVYTDNQWTDNDYGVAMSLSWVESAQGTGNSFERNDVALGVSTGSGLVAFPNSRFVDNAYLGYNSSSQIVDVTYSWWGSPAGPEFCPVGFDCAPWRDHDGEQVPALSDIGLGLLGLALIAGGWWYISSHAPKSYL